MAGGCGCTDTHKCVSYVSDRQNSELQTMSALLRKHDQHHNQFDEDSKQPLFGFQTSRTNFWKANI